MIEDQMMTRLERGESQFQNIHFIRDPSKRDVVTGAMIRSGVVTNKWRQNQMAARV